MTLGRYDRAGYWMHKWPWATTHAFMAAAAIGAVAWQLLFWYAWTPLQRFYLKAYVGASMAEAGGLGPKGYRMLNAVDRRGPRLAQNRDVGELVTADRRTLLTITADGERRGVSMLRPADGRYQPAVIRGWLKASIYGGRSLSRLALPAVIIGSSALAGFLFFALPVDIRRTRERHQGRRLKGPVLTDVAGFNRAVRGDGIALYQQTAPHLSIPRKAERSHLAIFGDTGSGKSAIIRQILLQIRARGEQAIVYDPAQEYTRLFYDPNLGDIILNPLDARCPYWVPGEEVSSDPEALAMAQALFVDSPGDQRFFTTAAREIFAFLLMRHSPTAAELVSWMTYGDTLDVMLQDTPLAAYIHNTAPPQRTAVMATLAGVARTLATLPHEDNGAGCWSAASWAEHRRGFIFLTSTPQSRARLIPLQSLWLDTLILRLMESESSRPPTWFVLDEVASLNRLPQLHTAVTENRKYNNPIVIGCQGKAQLEARYGRDAETMIAQPATKILLRTAEPNAADWASRAIGEIEQERQEESRRDAWGFGDDNHQLSQRRSVERLVMASEMEGLEDLRGYVKYGNHVARLHVAYLNLPERHPGFVPRITTAAPDRLQPLATDVPCVVQSLA